MIFVIIFLIIILVFISAKVVQQNYVGLVETLGKHSKTVQSGLVFIIPFFQRIRRVSLALQPMKIDRYTIITNILCF